MIRNDLTGKSFERLKVLASTEKRTKDRQIIYKCLCDCGKEVLIAGRSLIKGATKSCGCFKKDQSRKELGEASFNRVYGYYKSSAIKRKLVFSITKIEFKELTQKNCYYCKSPPLNGGGIKSFRYYGPYTHNGLDRVDNNVGYILINVVPCCKFCNYAKHTSSQEEFVAWLNRVRNG